VSGPALKNRDATELVSRRQLLVGAGAFIGAAAMGGGALGATRLLHKSHPVRPARPARPARPEPRIRSFPSRSTGVDRRFRTLPDLLPPPVQTTGAQNEADYLFLGPGSTSGFTQGPPKQGPQQGPLIVDRNGELVFFRPMTGADWATNVRVQQYRGNPVLTWWEGKVVNPGFGQGEGVILDESYHEVARVRAGNGRQADMHEFVLTDNGTALITCCPATVSVDLSSIGGPSNGTVLDAIIQEIDVPSGRVLFEWHSLDHIPVSDSYQPFAEPYDYFHANSIDLLPDGNLLISARATFALYKLDRRTGEVAWRLGGKRSQFDLGPGAAFSWQHDARQLNPGLITVFDDGSGPEKTESQSRGLFLDVDTAGRSVRLARAYRHPQPLLSGSMGNVQLLPDGRVFVGWGAQRYASEFAPDGTLLADAMLPSGLFSYRTYRGGWSGTPQDTPPAVAANRSARTGRTILFASWNGATDVAHWRVHAGPSARHLEPLGIAVNRGFETGIPLHAGAGWAAISALDSAGRELASSPAVRV
jgi:hypothetical protein